MVLRQASVPAWTGTKEGEPAIWGMCGAILSVPLLGVMKVLLDEADYPLAKQMLTLIREDSTVDEEAMMTAMVKELPGYQQEHSYSISTAGSPKSETKNPTFGTETAV